jgi:hypothetical protein
MDRIFMQAVKLQVSSLRENRFQDFVDYLYTTSFGTDFVPIRQKHDKGCDGLLAREGTIVSVYAPQGYTLAAFRKKAAEDFRKYESSWAPKYPHWQFVYNGTLTAEAQDFLLGLKADVELVTIDHLLGKIERLTWSERRHLARRLGIDEQFLIYNILDAVLDDLLARADSHHELPRWQPALYIGDKIALNFQVQDVDTAKSQQAECMIYFGVLQRLLSKMTDSEISSLKSKVMADYMALAGTFPERLTHLTVSYSGNQHGDEMYVFFIRVFLLFLFEQCVIGRRTIDETQC